MLEFQTEQTFSNNTDGDLTEFFQTEDVSGFAHWQGNSQTVTLERFSQIIEQIKENPNNPDLLLPTKFALVLITGTNDVAKFQFFGGAKIKLLRNGKLITLFKNTTGKILPTDVITLLVNSVDFDVQKVTPIKEESPFVQNPNFKLHSPQNVSLGFEFKPIFNHRGLKESFLNFFGEVQEKPRSMYIILLIIVVIIASLLYQLRSKTSEKKDQLLVEMTQSLEKQIEQSKTLNEINPNLARSQMQNAKQELLQSATANFGNWQQDKNGIKEKIDKLISKTDQEIMSISKIYEVTNLQTHYDTSLLRADAKITSASIHQEKIVLLDGSNGAIFQINSANKSGEILSTDAKFKGGKNIDFSGNQTFVFGQNVITYPQSATIEKSDSWGSIVSVKAFSGNVYLLDSAKNAIWKYSPTGTTFTGPKNYLGEGLTINLNNAIDLTINGEVIVLTKTGSLVRFASGIPQTTTVVGIDTPLNNPTAVFANEDTQNIYVLDSGNNRVVLTNNKGEYQSQYHLPNNLNLSPIILADESVKKIFLFSGSKVLSFETK